MRLFGRAPRKHAHAELVEDRGVVRRLLRDSGQQLVRLGHPPGGRFRLGSLQYPNDNRVVERWGGA
ncbi:MAG: hypothetical protein NVS9B2_26480 [Steroidobacteraceae bacterium]